MLTAYTPLGNRRSLVSAGWIALPRWANRRLAVRGARRQSGAWRRDACGQDCGACAAARTATRSRPPGRAPARHALVWMQAASAQPSHVTHSIRRHGHTVCAAILDTARRLANLGIHPWVLPRGGFYLWCKFPKGIETTQVARNAMSQNVVLAPGNAFSPSRTLPDFMRFNVSQMTDRKIYDVLEHAMQQDTQ